MQAIYHANKDRDAVIRQKADLTVNQEALSTTSRERALELWGQARVVAGQALWMPRPAFVDRLKATGVINQASISKAAWDSTVGAMADAWDVVKYAAGFAIGLFEGAWGALGDLFNGGLDLVKMVWTVIKDIFNDFAELRALAKKISEAWKNRDAILPGARGTE